MTMSAVIRTYLHKSKEKWSTQMHLLNPRSLAVAFSMAIVPLAAVCSTSAETQTKSTADVTMPAMVVTATRDERLQKDAPYASNLLRADALRLELSARSLPEALSGQPSTMIQKTAHGQGSPYIRGFTGYRNLFLVDGIRLNNSTFRDGPNQYWNTVDTWGLHQIEMVRGPFSALYGSDAIGGVVNAITRGMADLSPGSDSDRRLYYRYSSSENSHIARADAIQKLTDDLTLSLGYTFKDFGDVEGGREVGTQRKTGYSEMDWDAKLEYFVNENAYWVLAHQGVDIDDAWRTHKTTYGIDWEGLSVGSELHRILDQNRDLTYLQYHQYNGDGLAKEIHAGLSYHRQSEERNRLRTRNRHDIQGVDIDTSGAFLSLKSESPVGALIYGAEFYHDEVDSFKNTLNSDGSVASSAIQGPVGDDATYDSFGAYLQDEVAVTDPLSVILGARYEYAQADVGSVEDPVTGNEVSVAGDWDALVGSARMLYSLNEKKTSNAFGGISQGFRAPNLSDLTRLDSARTDEIETPSPELDPEHFVSYELGIRRASPNQSAQLTCFYIAIDGMIVRTPTGRVIDGDYEVTKRNGGDGYVQGVEFEARRRLLRQLDLFGTFTWMEGKVDTYPTSDAKPVSEYIDRLMPPTGQIGLCWNRGGTYWAEASCTIAGKADKLSTRDQADTSRIPPGGTPGYTVFDVKAGWNFSEALALCVAVENVADKDYRIHGSGVNEPGRNVVLSMQTTF
ncbi:MAG: TonB-dependent receptor [Verrucomicrobia bacterium]|nr:TonB-dependent receptor [Verrucomicrobiota bacterium]